MSERMYNIFIFGIVFNLFFSVFGYAFTTFAYEAIPENYEIAIDNEELWKQGIIFLNATSFNVTYNEDWHYFSQNNKDFRVKWYEPIIPLNSPAGFYFEKQSLIEQWLDTWIYPEKIPLLVGEEGAIFLTEIDNSSIVNYFDIDAHWTEIKFEGLICLLSTIPGDEANISKAIFDTGIITVTVGKGSSNQDFDLQNFAEWYWDTLFSFNALGIPESILWFTKIITTINFVSAIYVLREATKV